jgi:DNA-binding transcriptional regulator YhcF (GntR family)
LTTQALETIRRAMENGDARLAYRLLVDAGVVPQPGQISRLMESESSEAAETSAKKKYVVELVEQAIERAKDYHLPSDALQLRPARTAGTMAEKTS